MSSTSTSPPPTTRTTTTTAPPLTETQKSILQELEKILLTARAIDKQLKQTIALIEGVKKGGLHAQSQSRSLGLKSVAGVGGVVSGAEVGTGEVVPLVQAAREVVRKGEVVLRFALGLEEGDGDGEGGSEGGDDEAEEAEEAEEEDAEEER